MAIKEHSTEKKKYENVVNKQLYPKSDSQKENVVLLLFAH